MKDDFLYAPAPGLEGDFAGRRKSKIPFQTRLLVFHFAIHDDLI